MANSLNEKFEDFVSGNIDAETVTEMKNAVTAGSAPAESSHLTKASASEVSVANVEPMAAGSSAEYNGKFENSGAKAAAAVKKSKTQVNAGEGGQDPMPKLGSSFPGDRGGKGTTRGGGESMPTLTKEEKEEKENEGSKVDKKEDKKEYGKKNSSASEEDDNKFIKKMKKEDLDITDDVNALVNGEDLSEEFKEKATTIFEAALVSKLNEEIGKLEEQYAAQLNEQIEVIKEEMTGKVDSFLNYVVEQWIQDNKIAIDHGVRTEIAESFMSALKGVFVEHYIDMPEEKYDMVEGMTEKLDEMEQKLNEQIEKNIDLNSALGEFIKESIVAEVSQGLADTQKEKLFSLSEGVEFTTEETYREKIETIKENYFPKVQVLESAEASEPVIEQQVPAHMAAYVNAIARYSK
jgi:hypothetical protein